MAGQTSVETGRSAVDEVFVTHELESRSPRQRDYRREKEAVHELAAHLTDDPAEVLPRFVELAMELTGGSSAGLSLYEPVAGEAGVFRWRHLHGALASFEDATTPRDNSPCGVTLDRNQPVLARHPERIYDWIAEQGISLAEVLLVPLHVGREEPLGTLWVTADEAAHFHKEDANVAAELAHFVAIALRMIRSEEQLREALRHQELLALEMGHRVKNIFAVTESIVRLTAGRAQTPDELADSLGRRLSALAAAHALARGTALPDCAEIDLCELVETVVAPFNIDSARFSMAGPEVHCSSQAASALALVIHELATNAAKYGALAEARGKVAITWSVDCEAVELNWRESGGPRVEAAPGSSGFGSTLIRRTITQQFSGEIDEQWLGEGLSCTMKLALAKLGS